MGFMDLSTSVASKKNVDFNDARYQMADKLKQSGRQGMRSTFTLYDNKELNKIAIHDISAAYALSDKRLPMGELLNKMVDLIVDLEYGVLEAGGDAAYAWKYSAALLAMYEDKIQRQESLSVFDNGLKNSVINSKLFINRYPGRYTNRTNFFDSKVKESLEVDIIDTFKEIAIPQIHEIAVQQSRKIAEQHSNPIMDKIVQWAVTNYKCTVESFFDIKEEPTTNLYFSINTVILHLRNGYDMSIVGYVGTDHDDKFSISLFDPLNIAIKQHDEKISQDEIQQALIEAAQNAPISPLIKLYNLDRKKNEVLRQCYDILVNTRPMIPAHVLEIEAAESVVGKDYIWGCQQFRLTHEDLPTDFKLSDVILPVFVEEDARREYDEELAKADELIDMADEETVDRREDAIPVATAPQSESPLPLPIEEDLFGDDDPKKPVLSWHSNDYVIGGQFGALNTNDGQMPNLPSEIPTGQVLHDEHSAYDKFDASMTLLPGISHQQSTDEDDIPSVTKDAQPKPIVEEPIITWKEEKPQEDTKLAPQQNVEKEQDANRPELLIDDLDSLFA